MLYEGFKVMWIRKLIVTNEFILSLEVYYMSLEQQRTYNISGTDVSMLLSFTVTIIIVTLTKD